MASLAGGVLLLGGYGQAAYLTDWSAGDVFSYTDPIGEPLVTGGGPAVSGADITNWYYRLDGGMHYFRMDLVSAPTAGNAAPEYSFQFDNAPGGDDNSVTGYVAYPLTGIDEMLIAHFADQTGVWIGWHQHFTTGGAPTTSNIETINGAANPNPGPPDVVGSLFQSTENGGTTLEWGMPTGAMLGVNLFATWGATHDINDAFGGTFDITETNVIPEPASLALLGLLGGVTALRRPRRQ